MKDFIFTWGFIMTAAVFDVVAVILIKMRLNILGPVKFSSFTETFTYCINVISTVQTFFATLVILLSPVLYGFALSRINLSTAYPLIIGFSAISLVLCSIFILNEPVSTNKLIGIITIVCGISLIYWK
jgi:multidrug transporter EmrE-like cation transporter